jgi:hypothetical protein
VDFRAEPCGCERVIGMSRSRERHECLHGNLLVYTKALGSANGSAALAQISPASEAQRSKVRGDVSIISAKGPCDPAHLWDRRLGGCDDPLCVGPLTRFEHRDFEEKRLDILPALIAGGYFAEMAHVVEAHQVSPKRLLERLTGEEYLPAADFARELELAKARIVELEAGVRA